MKFTSDVLSGASGSIGGTTYSHNRGGQYTRKRAVPTNPSSVRQGAVRSAFQGLVSAWSNELTPAERIAWTTFADNTPQSDALGQTLILTGQQAYIKANSVRLQAGLARIDAAPIDFDNGPGVNPLLPLTWNSDGAADPEYQLAFAYPAPQPAAGNVLFYVGRPQNASRNFYKGPYQYAHKVSFLAAATATPTTAAVPSDWAADIVPLVGQWVPYAIRIALNDGRLSSITRGFVEVTEI